MDKCLLGNNPDRVIDAPDPEIYQLGNAHTRELHSHCTGQEDRCRMSKLLLHRQHFLVRMVSNPGNHFPLRRSRVDKTCRRKLQHCCLQSLVRKACNHSVCWNLRMCLGHTPHSWAAQSRLQRCLRSKAHTPDLLVASLSDIDGILLRHQEWIQQNTQACTCELLTPS